MSLHMCGYRLGVFLDCGLHGQPSLIMVTIGRTTTRPILIIWWMMGRTCGKLQKDSLRYQPICQLRVCATTSERIRERGLFLDLIAVRVDTGCILRPFTKPSEPDHGVLVPLGYDAGWLTWRALDSIPAGDSWTWQIDQARALGPHVSINRDYSITRRTAVNSCDYMRPTDMRSTRRFA